MSSRGNFSAPLKTATYTTRPEIEKLREELLINPFFQNIQNKILVELQQDLTYLIEDLLKQNQMVKAKKYQNLSIQIDKEARKRIANPGLAPPTPVELPKNSKEAKKLAKFDAETEEKIKHMQKRHESIIDNFKTLWDTQIKQKYFTDSPQLVKMRRNLRNAIQMGEEMQANELQKEIEEQEQTEREENQINYDKDYSSAYKQLVMKQKKEIKAYQQDRKRERLAIVPMMPIQVDRSLNRAKSKYANPSMMQAISSKPKVFTPQRSQSNSSSISQKQSTMLITSTNKAKILSRSNPKPPLQKGKLPIQKKNSPQKLGPLSPLKQTNHDIGCQCEDVSDSELFEDSENEGVTHEGDEILIEKSKNSSSSDEEIVEEKKAILKLGEEPKKEQHVIDHVTTKMQIFRLDDAPSMEDDVGLIASYALDDVICNAFDDYVVSSAFTEESFADIIEEALSTCIVNNT